MIARSSFGGCIVAGKRNRFAKRKSNARWLSDLDAGPQLVKSAPELSGKPLAAGFCSAPAASASPLRNCGIERRLVFLVSGNFIELALPGSGIAEHFELAWAVKVDKPTTGETQQAAFLVSTWSCLEIAS